MQNKGGRQALIRRNVKKVATAKSPLERGAALAAGCVTSLNLLVFTPIYVLTDFRTKHTPALTCHPSREGIFWVTSQQLPFRVIFNLYDN